MGTSLNRLCVSLRHNWHLHSLVSHCIFGHVNLLDHLDVLDGCILSLHHHRTVFSELQLVGPCLCTQGRLPPVDGLHLGCSGSLLHFQILRRLVLHLNDHVDNLLVVQELQELHLRSLPYLQDCLHRKMERQHVARLTCPLCQ